MARLKSIAKSDQLDLNLFLKSINITLDSENPERIKHFHPTGKSVLLIKALAGLEKDRAFLSLHHTVQVSPLHPLFSCILLKIKQIQDL